LWSSTTNGLTVSFDGRASTGSPTAYTWNFGDGQTGTGAQVQHTYATGGSYNVVLAVSKPGSGCPFGVCNSELSKVIQVGSGGTPTATPTPPTGPCVPDADTFCALNGDFSIEVAWKKKNGETGVGKVVPSATSDNTGVFYFFEDYNWELLLKVLDGCTINQRFWVFGGAATNVEYQIKVKDLVANDEWIYDNPQGKSSDAITDTGAFATCNVDRNLMRENARAELVERICVGCPEGSATPTPTPSPSPTVPANVGPCDPNSTTLCAISERFQVRVNWKTKSGNTGNGAVVPAITDNTGVFWFFQQENWELLIKVLNGCQLNDHFWVFGAGATDVNYTVTVEDLATGATWEYENPLGQASPAITDTTAFNTCSP
jgi:PKD repeat protein